MRPPDPIILEWNPPSIAEQEIIALADCVESYSVVTRLPGVTRDGPNGMKTFVTTSSGTGIRTKVQGSNLSEAQRDAITQILLVDLASSPPVQRIAACSFWTTHGIRFWRGAEFVDAFFCMGCNEAQVGSGSGPVDSVAERLETLFAALK